MYYKCTRIGCIEAGAVQFAGGIFTLQLGIVRGLLIRYIPASSFGILKALDSQRNFLSSI